MITRNGRRYLAGINSGSTERNECDCQTVDQYHRVSDSYAAFVLPTIGDPAPPATCGDRDGAGEAVRCGPGLTARDTHTPCTTCTDDGDECCTG